MLTFAWMRRLVLVLSLLVSGHALAADQCPTLVQRQSDPQVATRIAVLTQSAPKRPAGLVIR